MTTQVRTSYLPSEILWGHRLAPLLTYQKENGQYKVDYTQFHAVVPIPMPDYSARRLDERKRMMADIPEEEDADDGDDVEGGGSSNGGYRVHNTAPILLKPSSRRAAILRRFRGTVRSALHRKSSSRGGGETGNGLDKSAAKSPSSPKADNNNVKMSLSTPSSPSPRDDATGGISLVDVKNSTVH